MALTRASIWWSSSPSPSPRCRASCGWSRRRAVVREQSNIMPRRHRHAFPRLMLPTSCPTPSPLIGRHLHRRLAVLVESYLSFSRRHAAGDPERGNIIAEGRLTCSSPSGTSVPSVFLALMVLSITSSRRVRDMLDPRWRGGVMDGDPSSREGLRTEFATGDGPPAVARSPNLSFEVRRGETLCIVANPVAARAHRAVVLRLLPRPYGGSGRPRAVRKPRPGALRRPRSARSAAARSR